MSKEKVGGANTWSADRGGQPTGFWLRPGSSSARRLLGGPLCRFCQIPRYPRSGTCSSGLMDPCEAEWSALIG